MRVLILVGMLLWMGNCFGGDCDQYDSLSPLQKGRLLFSYHQGQDLDLGYTLSSIALVESSAGKYRINPYSRDFGLYQVNIKTAVNVMGVTNYYKKLGLAEKLIYQDILSSYIALDVLQYFYKYHKGDWKKMVQSYNEGFKIDTKKSLSYLDKVSEEVVMLKRCLFVK